jgi:hypothetical protein
MWTIEQPEKLIDTKEDVLNESKNEQNELSIEKLQSITNNEFLVIAPEQRLKYINKSNIESKDLLKDKFQISNIEFTFTFNWKFNRELWLKTTAGQVLPNKIREVEVNWIRYQRSWLKWEFFSSWWKRLIINEWTKVDIEKIATKEEIEKMEGKINKKTKEFLEKNQWANKYSDIVLEAYKRNMDPKFAISAFWEKIKDIPLVWLNRRVLLEDMFTEYDRVKGNIPSVMNNSWDWLKVLILRQFWW